jgi:hypothetical protein
VERSAFISGVLFGSLVTFLATGLWFTGGGWAALAIAVIGGLGILSMALNADKS